MVDDAITKKFDEFSERLLEHLDDLGLGGWSRSFVLWKEHRSIFGMNNLEEIGANSNALDIRNDIISYIVGLLEENDDIIIDILKDGYPSVDIIGLLPLFDIASNKYFDEQSYHISHELEFLRPYITFSRLISLDILHNFINRVLDADEKIQALEYGIGDFTDLISIVRLPGIFLTDRRLIVAGTDVLCTNSGSMATVMLYPGVRTSFAISPFEHNTRLYYPDYNEHRYYGSLDHISLDAIDGIKEKKGAIEIGLKKDFRVLALSEKRPNNRYLGTIEGDLRKPLSGRKMRIYPVSDKQVDKDMNKSRLDIFKSSIEDTWKSTHR